MIKEIRVLSRDQVEQFAQDITGNLLAGYFDCTKTALISILSPSEEMGFEIKCEEMVAVTFDDVIEPAEGKKPIDKDQCAALGSFIRDLHAQEDPYLLIVHCADGKNRSGAVATFACQVAELPEIRFTHLNPELTPNPLVLTMLQEHY